MIGKTIAPTLLSCAVLGLAGANADAATRHYRADATRHYRADAGVTRFHRTAPLRTGYSWSSPRSYYVPYPDPTRWHPSRPGEAF
jgi:hypothetical protein